MSWRKASSRRRRSLDRGAAATTARASDTGPADRALGHRDESVGHDVGRQAAATEQLVECLEARDDAQDIGRLVDGNAVPEIALLGEPPRDLGLARPSAVLDRAHRRDRIWID